MKRRNIEINSKIKIERDKVSTFTKKRQGKKEEGIH